MTTPASRAMIATSAVLMALACISVVVRLHLRRKTKSTGSRADDWLIVAALVWPERCYPQPMELIATFRLFRLHWPSPISSAFPLEISECHFHHLLIPRLKPSSRYVLAKIHYPPHVLNATIDCVHTAILVHSCRGHGEAFHTLSLRTTLLRRPISRDH